MATPIQPTGIEPSISAPREGRIEKPAPEAMKAQKDAAILQASMEVTLSAKNNTLQLLLTSVIANLNEVLQADLGENAIQNAVNQDNTPEGTATRIVDLSTALFAAFKEQHPELDDAAVLDRFLEVIGKGIDQGFKEAREILDGLGVLQGDIASNIDKTYELVQQKLDAFRSRMLEPPPEQSS